MNIINSSNRYFAAANSGKGFKSYFEELFFGENIKRRYIIKGGPGTGKSSLMRRMGEAAQSKGRFVEYYYCSSDTGSLDGVIIDSSIAIFDGTSPHSYDTVLPGACDELVNLGEFWDSESLTARADEITKLVKIKKGCYLRAYKYLSAAYSVSLSLDLLSERVLNTEKLRAAAWRMSEKFPCGDGAIAVPSLTSAIGIRGRVRLDSFEERAKKIYFVDDAYGVAKIYLSEIARSLLGRGCRIRVAYDPVNTDNIEGIFVEDSLECLVVSSEKDEAVCERWSKDSSRINMKRFLFLDKIPNIRQEYRKAKKSLDSLLSLAEDSLSESGKAHFELEKIYVSNMDFLSLDSMISELSSKI